MLKMRARAFALRDGFADVLGGMYIAEELQDMRDVTPPASPPSPPSPPQIEAKAFPPSPPPTPKPKQEPIHVPLSGRARKDEVVGHDQETGEIFDDESGIPEHMRSEHDIAAREEEQEKDVHGETLEDSAAAEAELRGTEAVNDRRNGPHPPTEQQIFIYRERVKWLTNANTRAVLKERAKNPEHLEEVAKLTEGQKTNLRDVYANHAAALQGALLSAG
jgi:hypothetical protein